jgi:putative peptidoglycan lipid II flippase
VAVVVLVLTQLMNLVFVPRLGHAGLALSIGVAALINAGWLLWGLRRRGSYRPLPGWWGFGLRVVLASAVMGAGLAWASSRFDWVALGTHELVRAGWLAAVIVGAVVVYFAVLLASGLRIKAFIKKA